MTAPDQVTLYRVRRPDGTVIEAEPKDHRYSAAIAASYSEPQLHNLILAADEDQKFDDYLKITKFKVEPVTYFPATALEAAQARIAEIEIATLEKAAGLLCEACTIDASPHCAGGGVYTHLDEEGMEFSCFASPIHAELARLKGRRGEGE